MFFLLDYRRDSSFFGETNRVVLPSLLVKGVSTMNNRLNENQEPTYTTNYMPTGYGIPQETAFSHQYSAEEQEKILALAIRLKAKDNDRRQLADIERVAAEVGVEPEYVRQAANLLNQDRNNQSYHQATPTLPLLPFKQLKPVSRVNKPVDRMIWIVSTVLVTIFTITMMSSRMQSGSSMILMFAGWIGIALYAGAFISRASSAIRLGFLVGILPPMIAIIFSVLRGNYSFNYGDFGENLRLAMLQLLAFIGIGVGGSVVAMIGRYGYRGLTKFLQWFDKKEIQAKPKEFNTNW